MTYIRLEKYICDADDCDELDATEYTAGMVVPEGIPPDWVAVYAAFELPYKHYCPKHKLTVDSAVI